MARACQPGGEALTSCSAFWGAEHTPLPVAHEPHTSLEEALLQRGKVTYPGKKDVNKKSQEQTLGLQTCVWAAVSSIPLFLPKSQRQEHVSRSSLRFRATQLSANLGRGQVLKWAGVAESGGGSEGHLVLSHGLSWSWGQVPIKRRGCENPVFPPWALHESQGQQ